MKMTGHLLYGNYRKGKKSDGEKKHEWKWWGETKALQDPFNRFIHLVFTFNDNTSLAFCDARKFGKVTLIPTQEESSTPHLAKLGPDALEDIISFSKFKTQIMKRSNKAIKTVLMEQEIITGIGNIYSDEMLWLSNIHPERTPKSLLDAEWKLLHKSMKPVLEKGIRFGGDSTSDYRNIYGEHGNFHHAHNAYRKTGTPCLKKNCKGFIQRKIINGRSGHFCSIHQK
jgi:formamidopyrimidine-DNA glycosylase